MLPNPAHSHVHAFSTTHPLRSILAINCQPSTNDSTKKSNQPTNHPSIQHTKNPFIKPFENHHTKLKSLIHPPHKAPNNHIQQAHHTLLSFTASTTTGNSPSASKGRLLRCLMVGSSWAGPKGSVLFLAQQVSS